MPAGWSAVTASAVIGMSARVLAEGTNAPRRSSDDRHAAHHPAVPVYITTVASDGLTFTQVDARIHVTTPIVEFEDDYGIARKVKVAFRLDGRGGDFRAMPTPFPEHRGRPSTTASGSPSWPSRAPTRTCSTRPSARTCSAIA